MPNSSVECRHHVTTIEPFEFELTGDTLCLHRTPHRNRSTLCHKRMISDSWGRCTCLGEISGLVPTTAAAGDRQSRQSPCPDAGHRTRLAVDQESASTKWFVERAGTATGRIRRIAIVALARKLMIALWRYLTTGMIPEGAIMKPA